ncbi:MAG: type II toxin-antitoxin system RelE/ParE family toxin, partial [Burkholderiales bacterium]|nr:type II toxin-antitoxin system RelE/ParE family toxin [Burkholderiales bacterium]
RGLRSRQRSSRAPDSGLSSPRMNSQNGLFRADYLVFYVERSDHVDVWRVLHGQRVIPAWMQEPGDA